MPSKEELKSMSKEITGQTIDLLYTVDKMPRKEFNTILPSSYSKKEIDQASDLLRKLLKWNPYERVSAEEALKSDFFRK